MQRMTSPRLFLVGALLCSGWAACGGGASNGDPDLAPAVDLAKPFVESGCPAPPVVTPDNLPAGYLPKAKVQLDYVVDGDTAHFIFPDGERTCRFLFVNTEESHGAETTDFGIATGPIVDGWLRAATTIEVAFERDNQDPTMASLDPFDRWLSLIFVDGELLQTRIVREGLSAYYTQFGCPKSPIHEALLYAEAEARANERGIWAPGHPTDYSQVLAQWIGSRTCRPNPFKNQPYCK